MKDTYLIKLGKTIKTYREINKLSQYDLAKLADVSQVAIFKWENGKSDPASSNIITLAKIFKITVDELLNNPIEEIKYENSYVFNKKIFNKVLIEENSDKITIEIKK